MVIALTIGAGICFNLSKHTHSKHDYDEHSPYAGVQGRHGGGRNGGSADAGRCGGPFATAVALILEAAAGAVVAVVVMTLTAAYDVVETAMAPTLSEESA